MAEKKVKDEIFQPYHEKDIYGMQDITKELNAVESWIGSL